MAHKTKAAMPGRQCDNTKHIQDTRLVAGGQSLGAPEITGTAPLARLGGMSKNRDTPFGSTNFSAYPPATRIMSRLGCQPSAYTHQPFGQCHFRTISFCGLSQSEFLGQTLYIKGPPTTIKKTKAIKIVFVIFGICNSLLVHAFGSMPRCCNSFRRIRFIHVASDESPSLRISSSSCERSSCANRIWYWSVLGFSLDIVITKLLSLNCCNYNVTQIVLQQQNTAKPGSVGALTGPLTNNVRGTYIMADQQHTQTHPKFTWLFLATPKSHPECSPVVLRFDTDTEENARAAFPGWEMVFAAKIRAESPCRVAFFDYNTRCGWAFDSASDREVVGHD